jgi:thiol-disulfide isomerase/thioredoxin
MVKRPNAAPEVRLAAPLAVAVSTVAAIVLAMAPACALEPGQAAPELAVVKGADATTPRLADYRGKVVYLDFWASWCGPCKQSFPWMAAMQARYAAQGLQIIAVNLDADSEDGRRFLAATPAAFPVIFDPEGKLPRLYAIKGMPSSFLIGRDGRVRKQHAGFNPGIRQQLEADLQSALEEQP